MGTRRRVTVHGTLTGKRAGDLDAVLRLGGLCVTTYGSLISQQSALTVRRWDVLVLDEATVVKNPETRVARTAVDVPSKMRLLLTGTPLQVKALW